MNKRVIELIRVSTEGQAADDRASIPAQRTVNRRTCAQYGLEIVRSIEFSDVSGASVLLAPEMRQLLAAIEDPGIDGVVAREFSRLMRPENFGDYALLQAFVDTKTVLYLPEGPLDLTTKTGRLMGTIRAAIAGLERTEILERIWSAKEEKRRRGELGQSGIVLPYGVGYEDGRGFYYKPEAERVREAFRRFLAGDHSYDQLAQLLGVTPRGASLILRNPIWTGWRVIDKKRDPSAAGRYRNADGRQADRRKVPRSPDEIIRVRVIDEPLISEQDFETVQKMMDLKQSKHWRTQPNIEHRFTYHGFLTCSGCGEVIHTALARRDYYACKGRRSLHTCPSKYMAREKLEKALDCMFSGKLTNAAFVEKCVEELHQRHDAKKSPGAIQRLTADLTAHRARRSRVVDSFVDGTIDRQERDHRLAVCDRDIQLTEEALLAETPDDSLDSHALVEAFAPLVEWEHWTRDQKRAVLATMTPDIRVADYRIESLGLNPMLFSNESTHSRVATSTTARASATVRQ